MRPFVACHLKNHEREAELEDDLKRDQASKGVVVALFRRREEPCNERHCNQSRQAGPTPGKNCEAYRPVDSEPFTQGLPGVLLTPCQPGKRPAVFRISGIQDASDLGEQNCLQFCRLSRQL